jgi:RNA-directed DNA polymerase
MRRVMRKWRLHLRSHKTLHDLAKEINPILRGWINYYGKYYKSQLGFTFNRLNRTLVRWVMRKYKRFSCDRQRKATYWLGKIAKQNPDLFAHWAVIVKPAAGR